MRMYRLTQKKYSDDPFSLIGAKLYGGRWNSKGTEALYFAESESLCTLEVFVHINNDPEIINKYNLYRIEIPDTLILKLEIDDLPMNWRTIPTNESTQEIGDQFLNAHNTDVVALQVPSSISPRDSNYIVKPSHPMMREIFIKAEKLDFNFDPRIFK